MSNINLGGKYLARVGKRRWRIEGFFKTIKGRFGLERFAQHSKTGVMRWCCLSGLAYLLCHLADQDVPPRPPGTWPDWGGGENRSVLVHLRSAPQSASIGN